MNTVLMYERTLEETITLRNNLEKEYDYNSRLYKSLKTDSATPDIPLLDFLNELPDWTKVLFAEIVILTIKYSTSPSEEGKNELVKKLLDRNQCILYETRKLDFTLNDCPFEIDEKISECDIKIEELQNQAKALTRRIAMIEAQKSKWVELKKKL